MTQTEWVERPWGRFLLVYHSPTLWVKTLVINPGARLSLQFHEHRTEVWHAPEGGLAARIGVHLLKLESGAVYTVPVGTPHRLYNPLQRPLTLVEVATGSPDEQDIVRIADDYGRQTQ